MHQNLTTGTTKQIKLRNRAFAIGGTSEAEELGKLANASGIYLHIVPKV